VLTHQRPTTRNVQATDILSPPSLASPSNSSRRHNSKKFKNKSIFLNSIAVSLVCFDRAHDGLPPATSFSKYLSLWHSKCPCLSSTSLALPLALPFPILLSFAFSLRGSSRFLPPKCNRWRSAGKSSKLLIVRWTSVWSGWRSFFRPFFCS